MSEISNTKALLTLKCPKCHETDLFVSSNPYNIKRIHEMPENCSTCGERFQMEPGFWYGAMYVNYGFGVLLFVLSYVVLELLLHVSSYIFFSVYIGTLVILGPYMFRYSRAIYLYLFVSYDKEAVQKHKVSK